MLPLVGFMLLMRMICKTDLELILFCVGFVLVKSLGLDMISIVVLALCIAYMQYKSTAAPVSESEE